MNFIERIKSRKWFYLGLFLAIFLFFPGSLSYFHPAYLAQSIKHGNYLTLIGFVLFFYLLVAILEKFWLKLILGLVIIGNVSFYLLSKAVDWGGLFVMYAGFICTIFFIVLLVLERFRDKKASQIVLTGLILIFGAFQVRTMFYNVHQAKSYQILNEAKETDTSLTIEQRIEKCKELSKDFSADRCIQDIVWKEAHAKNDPELCNLNTIEGFRSDCYTDLTRGGDEKERLTFCNTLQDTSAKDQCIRYVVSDAKNPQGCELISSPYSKESCYRGLASSMVDPRLCLHVKNENDQRYYCVAEVWQHANYYGRKPTKEDAIICETYKETSLPKYADGCYSSLAKQLKDASFCDKVADAQQKEKCIEGVTGVEQD